MNKSANVIKLLFQYLQKLGYITRLIGKWHLGSSKTSMTPTHRGFHSHFGYYNGYVGNKNGIHDWVEYDFYTSNLFVQGGPDLPCQKFFRLI